MFTKEYVGVILAPFVGKCITMDTNNNKTIPFHLGTQATFQIELDDWGIRFFLKDHYYVKRALDSLFRDAFKQSGISPRHLDTFLKDEKKANETDNVLFTQILAFVQEKLAPEIAFTYYTMITSLLVEEKGFSLNGIKFLIEDKGFSFNG